MRYNGWTLAAALGAAASFASCGGGGHTGSPLPTASTAAASHAGGASVTLVLTLPARTASSARRLPKYVSAATLGAGVTVTVGGNPVTTAFSLAPNSSSCAVSGGVTTCTLNAAASGFGAATIAVALYDQTPVSGVIPASASVLSSGTVGATLAEGVANVTLPVVLSGTVEGVTAAGTTLTASGGTAAQTTFVFEATDADANVILASDGVIMRTGTAATFTLVVPASIAGVTLLDFTQQPTGTASTSITGVKAGDIIQISTSTSTPRVMGFPLAVLLYATPIGIVRVPSNNTPAPTALSTSFSGTVSEIASVPAWSGFASIFNGNGFLSVAGAATQYVTGLTMNLSTHTLNQVFQCSVASTTYIIDHMAVGMYPHLAFAVHTNTDETLNTVTLQNGTCPSGTQAFSAYTEYGVPPTVGTWNDVADDGTSLGGALQMAIPTNGQNAIVTAPELGTASGGGTVIGNSTNQAAIDSLQMWYGKTAVVAKGLDQLVYVNELSAPFDFGLSASSPVAAAADTAGNIFLQFHDAAGTVMKCVLGYPGSCITLGSISAYGPSYDHRGMALGPDGDLYFATTSGLVQLDYIHNTSVSEGLTSYSQVVASGDGHLYMLRANGSGVDAAP